jgi:hypothetical protein
MTKPIPGVFSTTSIATQSLDADEDDTSIASVLA